MSKRVARLLRGHARLLADVKDSIKRGWSDNALVVLDDVIANLKRDADDEEQRGRDWADDPLRGYRLARERALKEMGIEEQERKAIPPREEPWL